MTRRTSPGTAHDTAQDTDRTTGSNRRRTPLLTALAAVACEGLTACSGAHEGEGPALAEATGSLTTATP